ncbi:YggS family pyridoxal phosphate-dependent enzyme [bacterium]|nr:YggS family pyridoxal phosphate-dependent enzyme [bacterium]
MQKTIEKNLLQIQEDIAPCKPNIIAVTKYFDEKAIVSAYNAGMRDFAESRAIEAIEKINNLPEDVRKNSKFHFIGHLQSNKVKKVVANFDYIHSVDSLKIAELISQEAHKIGKIQNILLQINNAGEEQKSGFSREEIFENFPEIQNLSNVKISGLMNMAPLGAEDSELEILFEDVYHIKQSLESKFNCKLEELSMGMSQDYKIAVKHGATMLRIGRKLFK